MIGHNFRSAVRHFNRHKGYAIINVLGLGTGIAACMLMILYVQDELTYDAFHRNAAGTFRLVSTVSSTRGEREVASVMGPLAPALLAEVPEVYAAVRLRDRSGMGRFAAGSPDRRFYEGDYIVAEESFFDVFDFVMLRGDRKSALTEVSTVVLTESAARKYFGSIDVVGKLLNTERLGDLRVTGLLQDPPGNSHLQFSMLISQASLSANSRWKEFLGAWSSDGFITYVSLKEGSDPASSEGKLRALVERHRPALQPALKGVRFQPVGDIHFGSGAIEFDRNSGKTAFFYVVLFAGIAIVILVIAGINYVNLATARAMSRAREIGLRKVVGAGRAQLVAQFLGESLLLSIAATLLAIAAVEFVLPVFNAIAGKELGLDLFGNIPFTLIVVGLTVAVGVISGLYPAFYLAALDPLTVVSGRGGRRSGRSFLRHALVTIQFAISLIMISATLTAQRQLDFIRTKNLGFDQDQLLVIDINSGATRRGFEAIKAEMSRVPGVKSVTATSRVPGDWKTIASVDVQRADMTGIQPMTFICIDGDFLKTFGVSLVEGRNLTTAPGSDTASILVNETAARLMGWTEPLHGEILVPSENYHAHVVGVVKDFHFRSLHEPIGPLVLGHWKNPIEAIDYFTLRLRTKEYGPVFASLEGIHRQFDQVTPLEWNFLDQRIDDFYRNDRRMGAIFEGAAILSIAVACLGLLGLMSFITQQRTKEIGVRKVLGAGLGDILLLLTRDFALPIVIGTVLATPVAYFMLRSWLEDFAYRVDLGPGMFLLASGVSVIIAIATVGSQAIRAAITNPAEAIRCE